MIPVSKAIRIVTGEVRPLGAESVALPQAVGRVLAQDIVADTDLPPFDRSQMDGYAVRAADVKDAPVVLKVVGESAAGSGWRGTLKPGEAVSIMTGAPLPKGADAVQKIELTADITGSPQFGGDTVTILEPVKKNQYIVPRAFEVKKGTVVFHRGRRITPEMSAVLAAFGYETVKVSVRPKVAILSTGSEIVEVGVKPARDQIRNSNSSMLRALAEKYGASVEVLPIAPDDKSDLKIDVFSAAERADMVVITGGVSVGKYDLTKTSLADLGASILFERIRLKPGKPTVFAKLGEKLVFGLPGNPVSVAVTFHLFVRAAILMLQGAEPDPESGFAVADRPVRGTKERDSYLPVTLKTNKHGVLRANPLRWHGSSDFVNFAQAQGVIIVPRGRHIEAGEPARVLFL